MTWHHVASTSDLLEGEAFPVMVGRTPIALVKLGEQVHGISDVCTHEFALLSDGWVEDGCIECPLHQARFHIATGERRDGPYCPDLATYPVKIEQDRVYVECD